jgi:hypothetical protein
MAGLLDLLKPQQVGGLLGSADNRTLLGLQMLANSGPSLTPRSGFEGIPELAAGMQQRQQQQRLMEEEKQRQSQLSSALVNAMPGLNPQLAQADPNMALKVFQAQQPKQKELPTSVQEFLYGQQNPEFFDHQLNMRRANQPNININPGERAFDSEFGKIEAQQFGTMLTAGSKAASQMQDFEVLRELTKIAPQGPLTGRMAEYLPGFDSAGSAFQSIVKRLAPTMRVEGSGSTSDIEYAGMLQSLPALLNKPEANRTILQIIENKAQIDMERASVVTDMRNGDISQQEARRRLTEIGRRSIMSPEMKRALIGVGALGADQNAEANNILSQARQALDEGRDPAMIRQRMDEAGIAYPEGFFNGYE